MFWIQNKSEEWRLKIKTQGISETYNDWINLQFWALRLFQCNSMDRSKMTRCVISFFFHNFEKAKGLIFHTGCVQVWKFWDLSMELLCVNYKIIRWPTGNLNTVSNVILICYLAKINSMIYDDDSSVLHTWFNFLTQND